MNADERRSVDRMTQLLKRFDVIDWLLVAAIVGLLVFLLTEVSPPLMKVWRNRPRPSVQVEQRYVAASNEWDMDYLLYLLAITTGASHGRWWSFFTGPGSEARTWSL